MHAGSGTLVDSITLARTQGWKPYASSAHANFLCLRLSRVFASLCVDSVAHATDSHWSERLHRVRSTSACAVACAFSRSLASCMSSCSLRSEWEISLKVLRYTSINDCNQHDNLMLQQSIRKRAAIASITEKCFHRESERNEIRREKKLGEKKNSESLPRILGENSETLNEAASSSYRCMVMQLI